MSQTTISAKLAASCFDLCCSLYVSLILSAPGLSAPDRQFHSCHSETSWIMTPILSDSFCRLKTCYDKISEGVINYVLNVKFVTHPGDDVRWTSIFVRSSSLCRSLK